MPTIEERALALVNEIDDLFRYEPETGNLLWKDRGAHLFTPFTKRVSSKTVTVSPDQQAKTWNTRYAGKIAGKANRDGYLSIKLKGKFFLAHRLIWLLHNGNWPQYEIDHLNGDPRDNRIENLRDVPHSVNMHNMAVHRDALSVADTCVTKRGGVISRAALAKRGLKLVEVGDAD